MKDKVLILGAGGHAKSLIDTLRFNKAVEIVSVVEKKRSTQPLFFGIPIISEHELITNYPPEKNVKLVNGIGSVKDTLLRAGVFKRFKRFGYQFIKVIHPQSYIGMGASVGEGTQLMCGGIIQAGCRIGDNVIVNTKASIDHDSEIGHHVHLAPGVTCCGHVKIGDYSHVGCGAIIIQNITLSKHSVVAAGAVVVKSVSTEGMKLVGIPAQALLNN